MKRTDSKQVVAEQEIKRPPDILEEAHSIIHVNREQLYGAADKNLKNIAAFWSIHLTGVFGQPVEITAKDVCSMMVLVKQARLISNPDHRDSAVDVCGYTALRELVS